jgi:hypothetical protein
MPGVLPARQALRGMMRKRDDAKGVLDLMKKKIHIYIVFFLALVLLAGCSAKESSDSGDAEVPEAGSFSEADIALKINGKVYRCSEDVDSLLEELGDDYSYSEAISCAYDGLDKSFSYTNFDVYTYPDGDVDRVSEITAYTNEVSTLKGLTVGDTVERMEELYGTGYSEEGITMVYEIPPRQENAEGASLYVTVEDGIIQSISITAEILVE